MKDLFDVYCELDGVYAVLTLLSTVATDEYRENVGQPSPEIFQNAIYSAATSIRYIKNTVDELNREKYKQKEA